MIRPLGDRILILPDAAQDKSAGGMIIPDSAQEKPSRGTVIAVPEPWLERGVRTCSSVHAGERVVFGKYSAFPIEEDGKQFVLVREADIIAAETVVPPDVLGIPIAIMGQPIPDAP